MGWRFKWVSSLGGDFNYDFGVSFTPEQMATGEIVYNYRVEKAESEELPGISVFYKDDKGGIFHTYELLSAAYMYLDLLPKGRDEADLPYPSAWWRHHDKYE
jgi:predicted dithiol-disulfide oxidoreductase (DUF899 family)